VEKLAFHTLAQSPVQQRAGAIPGFLFWTRVVIFLVTIFILSLLWPITFGLIIYITKGNKND